jgi:DNA-binding GntR family transcriptional regulator
MSNRVRKIFMPGSVRVQDKDYLKLPPTERVEEYIRQAIYRGELKPRERVIEEDVAKQLECSRGPVREAMQRLERDGLIVTLARRGRFIRDVSTESIEAICTMRGKLEALCVRYLREDLSEDTERTLRKALRQLKRAVDQKDEDAFFEADMNLHQTIWRLSNREILQRHLTMIINPFVFGFARTYSANAPFSLRYRDHAEYVEMVLTAPIRRVEHLVEQYFEKRAEVILSQLRTSSAVARNGHRTLG